MDEERAVAMSRRLARTAERAGLRGPERDRIVATFARVMDRRTPAIPDPAHIDYLHPARTALILLDDAGVTSIGALLAGLEYDSDRPDLSADAATLRRVAGDAAADVACQLPGPGLDDAALMEALVIADDDARNVAVAERLDHARHLHLGPHSRWRAVHARIVNVWIPVSRRAHPMLSRRLDRWAEAFEWRFLRRPGSPGG
jgi:hypothetical protein